MVGAIICAGALAVGLFWIGLELRDLVRGIMEEL